MLVISTHGLRFWVQEFWLMTGVAQQFQLLFFFIQGVKRQDLDSELSSSVRISQLWHQPQYMLSILHTLAVTLLPLFYFGDITMLSLFKDMMRHKIKGEHVMRFDRNGLLQGNNFLPLLHFWCLCCYTSKINPVVHHSTDAQWLADILKIIVKVYSSVPILITAILERLAVSVLEKVKLHKTL